MTSEPRNAPLGPSDASDSRGDGKRRRILDAALAVCARSGIAAARMEEVAAGARVSKGTLYRFFESKEDLFLATLTDAYERGLSALEARLAEPGDPRERLEGLFEGLVDVLVRVGPQVGLHYQAWGVVAADEAFEGRLLGFLREFHRARHADYEAIVREGQAAGAFRADASPAVVADGVAALLAGFLYRASFDPESARPEALRRCFDALIAGHLAPRPRS